MTLNHAGKIVAFTENGIFEWNGEQFAPAAPVAGETVKNVVLWSRTGAFYYVSDRTLHRIKDNRADDYFLSGAPREFLIRRIYEDRRGRIWVGTDNAGLFVLDGEQVTNYNVAGGLPENYISPQMEDLDGNIWAIGTKGAAIISDAGFSRLTAEQGLSDDVLNTIFQDSEGNIWAGGLTRGLNRISRQSVEFYSTL